MTTTLPEAVGLGSINSIKAVSISEKIRLKSAAAEGGVVNTNIIPIFYLTWCILIGNIVKYSDLNYIQSSGKLSTMQTISTSTLDNTVPVAITDNGSGVYTLQHFPEGL